MRRPDIVLFMTDQQRSDQLGFASDGYYQTPNLDALARRGVVFDNAYSAATVCVPARTALLSGLSPHRAQTQVGMSLKEGHWTIARAMRAAGYDTALIGKMHLNPIRSQHGFATLRTCEHLPSYGWNHGRNAIDDYHTWLLWQGYADHRVTHMFGPSLTKEARAFSAVNSAVPFPLDERFHPTGWVRDQTIEYLTHRGRDRPLLLIVSFPHPHAPYDPPEPYASMYANDDARLPTGDYRQTEELAPFLRRAEYKGRFRPRLAEGLDPAVVRRTHVHIRALVHQIDRAIGEILAHIDLDDSLVFFTADHGDYGGHRGLLGKVPWVPFDDLAKVPFICAGRGVAGARHVAAATQSFDWVSTALAAAGVPASGNLDATDLGPLLRGENQPEERAVYCGTSIGYPSIRHGGLKYIRHPHSDAELLFDLQADPGELRNLAAEPRLSGERAGLREILDRHLAAPPPDLPTNLGDA
ncbi:MAG TPA: sulfatase-like hydrolase/transferase [Fontimonas sp.]